MKWNKIIEMKRPQVTWFGMILTKNSVLKFKYIYFNVK